MELNLHGLETKCQESLKEPVNTAGKNVLDKELQAVEVLKCS